MTAARRPRRGTREHRPRPAGPAPNGDAGGGRVLVAGDDVVAVDDPGLDHRVAPNPEHEQLALAGEVGRQRVRLLDVLLRENVGTCGDVADERHVPGGAALDDTARA